MIAVYQMDSAGSLITIASNRQGDSPLSDCAFRAQVDTIYHIAIASAFGELGQVQLDLSPLTPALNTAPNTAIRLRGNHRSVLTSNVATTPTANSGTALDGTRSLWWRWVAFADGMVSIDTEGSSLDTILHVYSIKSAQQHLIASDDDVYPLAGPSRLTFDVTAGTAYDIAVSGFGDKVGAISVNLVGPGIPPADFVLKASAGTAGVRLVAQGEADSPYLLEASDDLDKWDKISSGWFEGLPIEFTEQSSDLHAMRFLRLRRP